PQQPRELEACTLGRQASERVGRGFPHLRQRRQAARSAARDRWNETAWVRSGCRIQPWTYPAVVCGGVRDPANLSAGRGIADWLPRWRRGDPRTRRKPALHTHPVSLLRRGAPLGRSHIAGCTTASVPALARREAIMNTVTSADGTAIAYDRTG